MKESTTEYSFHVRVSIRTKKYHVQPLHSINILVFRKLKILYFDGIIYTFSA